jgi:hypothetical protein
MTEYDLLNIGLIKWPALVVKGESVTEDQAKEILIRTDSMYLHCNDDEWNSLINGKLYGVDPKLLSGRYDSVDEELRKKHNIYEKDYTSLWNIKDLYKGEVGIIDGLEYLHNNRIASSWVGGAHGWCNWDGTIGTSEYNIGKYPSVSEVYEEWKLIAKEFPFLNLRCQIMSEEACDPESEEAERIRPVVEFIIGNGVAKLVEPEEILKIPNFKWINGRHERGCSYETFSDAIDYTKSKIKMDSMLASGDAWIGVNK